MLSHQKRNNHLLNPPRFSLHGQKTTNSTTVFSHSQTVVLCGSCSTVLCTPTGGRARLTEGAFLSF
jgi:ribosomal protein S27E